MTGAVLMRQAEQMETSLAKCNQEVRMHCEAERGPAMAEAAVGRASDARRLLVLLFTDIFGSTERVVEFGDEYWDELLKRYRSQIRRELRQYGGHEVDAPGDGFFATFDAPPPAVSCAQAVVAAVRNLGLTCRVGLHYGAWSVGRREG
jgi:class 3 adenylate cyclase